MGATALLFVTPESPLSYVIACHVVMMLGVPLAMSPCQTHALSSLPRELSADGSTALNTMQQVLGAVCTAVATSLLTAGQASYVAAGGADATLAFTQGSHWGFAFALALAVIGFACALRIKVKKRANVGTGEVAAAMLPLMRLRRLRLQTSPTGDGSSPARRSEIRRPRVACRFRLAGVDLAEVHSAWFRLMRGLIVEGEC